MATIQKNTSLGGASFEPNIDRAPMRPTAEDHRQRAADKMAKMRGVYGDEVLDTGSDEFYVDPAVIPDGWDYEWKRDTLLGKEDPAYKVHLARGGWEAVPRTRHPEMMPHDSTDNFILRKGCILMERPMELSEHAREIEKKRARQQVRVKEEQLTQAPPGQFDRDNKGTPMATLKKSHVPMPIPE